VVSEKDRGVKDKGEKDKSEQASFLYEIQDREKVPYSKDR
jgi:hypothetical protein